MALGTRAGTKYGTADGTKYPPDGAAFTGIIDTLISGGATVLEGFSVSKRLWSGYNSPLFRVRRSVSNTQEYMGAAASGDLDQGALATFCTTEDGTIANIYGQYNAADWSQTTANQQAKIYDGATQATLKSGSLPLALGVNFGKFLKANTFGLSGSPDFWIAAGAKFANTASTRVVAGLTSNGMNLGVHTNGNVCVGNNAGFSSSRREFTPGTAVTEYCGYVAQWNAGGNYLTGVLRPTVRQNGVALTEVGGLSGTITMALNANSWLWGNAFDNSFGSADTILFGSGVLGGAALTALESFFAGNRTAAGY